MATQRRVSTEWAPGPLRCDVRTESGFVIAVDEPASAGGTNLGPQPTDLFLASVASCFTLAIAYSAAKHGLEPTRVDVEVVGIYDGPRFVNVEIVATIAGVEGAELDRLVASAERVCYVTNTLRRPPVVQVRVA